MLYYLKAEVLGETAAQSLEGIHARYRVGTMRAPINHATSYIH
jgi:hypothetical protein